MSKPVKEYRSQENGGSLQFFYKGEYVGSLPYPLLCALAKDQQAKDTILQNIQGSFNNERPKTGGNHTRPPSP